MKGSNKYHTNEIVKLGRVEQSILKLRPRLLKLVSNVNQADQLAKIMLDKKN